MSNFKKGDAVYRIASWNDRGTFYIVKAHVYSCGAKRMVLEAETGKCIGRDFKPNDASVYKRGLFQTVEAVEEEALALATRYIAANVAFWEAKRTNQSYHQPSVEEHIRELKANGPQVIWRED